jgi:hypothetical protein
MIMQYNSTYSASVLSLIETTALCLPSSNFPIAKLVFAMLKLHWDNGRFMRIVMGYGALQDVTIYL